MLLKKKENSRKKGEIKELKVKSISKSYTTIIQKEILKEYQTKPFFGSPLSIPSQVTVSLKMYSRLNAFVLCAVRESNSDHNLGKVEFYH